MKPTCLLVLPVDPAHPAHWWRLAAGQSSSGQLLPGQTLPAGPAGEHQVLAISDHQVRVRWLQLAAHSPAQACAAAPSALADELLGATDGLHVAAVRDGAHWQLLLCRRQLLEQALADARGYGMQPQQVLPTALLLDCAEDNHDGVLAEHQQHWFWRCPMQVISGEAHWLRSLLPNQPVAVASLAEQISLQQLPASNLLQGDFAAGRQSTRPLARGRILPALAACLLAVPLAIAAHAGGLHWQARQIHSDNRLLALQQAGISADSPDPVQQVHAQRAQQQQRQRQWQLLGSSLQAMAETPELAIEQLELGQGQLLLQLQPASVQARSQLQLALASQGLALRSDAANPDPNHMIVSPEPAQ